MLDIAGFKVCELFAKFECLVFVPKRTIPCLQKLGLPVEGLIPLGPEKWRVVNSASAPVLLRGNGKHTDRFHMMGWKVEPVFGRPLMPEVTDKGRDWRPDHVSGLEAVWVLATPPLVRPSVRRDAAAPDQRD